MSLSDAAHWAIENLPDASPSSASPTDSPSSDGEHHRHGAPKTLARDSVDEKDEQTSTPNFSISHARDGECAAKTGNGTGRENTEREYTVAASRYPWPPQTYGFGSADVRSVSDGNVAAITERLEQVALHKTQMKVVSGASRRDKESGVPDPISFKDQQRQVLAQGARPSTTAPNPSLSLSTISTIVLEEPQSPRPPTKTPNPPLSLSTIATVPLHLREIGTVNTSAPIPLPKQQILNDIPFLRPVELPTLVNTSADSPSANAKAPQATAAQSQLSFSSISTIHIPSSKPQTTRATPPSNFLTSTQLQQLTSSLAEVGAHIWFGISSHIPSEFANTRSHRFRPAWAWLVDGRLLVADEHQERRCILDLSAVSTIVLEQRYGRRLPSPSSRLQSISSNAIKCSVLEKDDEEQVVGISWVWICTSLQKEMSGLFAVLNREKTKMARRDREVDSLEVPITEIRIGKQ